MVHMVVGSRDINTVQSALVSSADGDAVDFSVGDFTDYKMERWRVDELDIVNGDVGGRKNAHEAGPGGASVLAGTVAVDVSLA